MQHPVSHACWAAAELTPPNKHGMRSLCTCEQSMTGHSLHPSPTRHTQHCQQVVQPPPQSCTATVVLKVSDCLLEASQAVGVW